MDKNRALVAIFCLAGAYSSAQASQFTEDDAVQVVATFAEAAACASDLDSDDFPVVKISEAEDPELMGHYGERYAVAWVGDLGCEGGRAATWHISYVGVGVANLPFVDLETPPITLQFIDVHSLEVNEDDNIVVKGQRYDFREGSGNWDFIDKTAVITPSGDLLESLVHVDGETHIESDVTDY